MTISLGSNIPSLRGLRQFGKVSTQLSTVYERLSSGQRIQGPSDDPAGLVLSESLRSKSIVLDQGIRNLADGLSLLLTADSAIESLHTIVARLEELAAQAANGAYSNEQRKALDGEARALSDEFLRISKTTEYNGRELFTGANPTVSLQAGVGKDAILQTSVGGAIGTGFFGAATSFATESGVSHALNVGDVNGDGILDLVTAGQDASIINGYATVRLGDGTGVFGAAASFATEAGGSNAVSLGDLNGDGILDLVTAGHAAGRGYATVRLGSGTGSFGAATSYSAETGTSIGLALGDINSDGHLDLVTAGRTTAAFDGTATVRLGDGSGSFGSAVTYSTESRSSYSVNLEDVNGDGVLDLITAGRSDALTGDATVRLGVGDGTFSTTSLSFQTQLRSIRGMRLGDVNGDNHMDLIVAGFSGSGGYASVHLGNGDGTFSSLTTYQTESTSSYAMELGDLNGDGILDLITAGRSSSGLVSVRLGDGMGSFGERATFQSEANRSNTVTIGDFDGDGVLDLITAGRDNSTQGIATLRLGDSVAGVAPLLEFSLETIADARQALPIFQRKREQFAAQRGEIGANHARIQVATNVLRVAAENFRAAESRIRDTDIATEAAKLTRLQVLQQANVAILAQANQQPAIVLALLT